jgi:hypothetical protein
MCQLPADGDAAHVSCAVAASVRKQTRSDSHERLLRRDAALHCYPLSPSYTRAKRGQRAPGCTRSMTVVWPIAS